MTARPATSEYDAYYAGYVGKAHDDPLAQFARQADEISALGSLQDGTASTSPAPGEWSLKEILVHLCDFERMFTYRALRFSRGDTTPVEAFEQDPYVEASQANTRALADIVEEFLSLRRSTMLLFGSFSEAMLARSGVAGGNPVTVHALVFITAGHCEGHLEDVRQMLSQR